MGILLVGFDSAWTPGNRGALAAILKLDDGSFRGLGSPRIVDFRDAESAVREWQAEHQPTQTVILIDQPTIVINSAGQRPVENIVSSCVSLRYGGMQPANIGRADMFGPSAPIWPFLAQFGGVANPLTPIGRVGCVLETYPVLVLIALGWVREDSRPRGRLPKYNPARRKTFLIDDWQYVCGKVSASFREQGLSDVTEWLDDARNNDRPRKVDQDKLDACLCLLVGLHLVEGRKSLMIGDRDTGYIVVPHSTDIQKELLDRCRIVGRLPEDWVRTFRLAVERGVESV